MALCLQGWWAVGGCVKSHFQVKLSWCVVDFGFENKQVNMFIYVLMSCCLFSCALGYLLVLPFYCTFILQI